MEFIGEKIYLPGDVLFEGRAPRSLELVVYEKDGKVIASVPLTLTEDKRIIPLESVFKPKVGDPIVGIVEDKRGPNFVVDTGTAYTGLILSRETKGIFRRDDVVFGKVARVEEGGTFILGEVRKLIGGRIFEVPPSKVPRIIGKGASMVNLIKEKTKTQIYVGANGYIWIRGSPRAVIKVMNAIKLIVRSSHLRGLTDRISKMLEE